MHGVYIHIPYCASKCRYCDFYSAGGNYGVPDAYISAVLREIKVFSPRLQNADTLYFGGGTPSLCTPSQISRVITAAAPTQNAEITMEANPETVTIETLRGYRAAGVNRISFGVQTASNDSLLRLGRKHTAADSRRALALAAQAGFVNISGDVMLALPNYSDAELADTLALLSEGGCTHISSYLLKIEPNTAFAKNPPTALPDSDAAADFYLESVDKLAALGYAQYEISNFAKLGFESRHNLLYWNCADYFAIGPAAHGCLDGARFFTQNDTKAFIKSPAVYAKEGEVTAEDYIMLQLRLASGLHLQALQEQYKITFDREKLAFIERCVQERLAIFNRGVLTLTPRGLLLQNSILCELL